MQKKTVFDAFSLKKIMHLCQKVKDFAQCQEFVKMSDNMMLHYLLLAVLLYTKFNDCIS